MATVQQDNVVIELATPIPYPIKTDGTADINGGDLVYFDTSAKVVKSLGNSTTQAALLAGLAKNGSFIQPYSSAKYFNQIPVLQKGIVSLNTTAAETYAEGDPVYYGGDAQTITNVDPGGATLLGYVKLGQGITSLTGASGVKVNVLLRVNYPTADFA
jgi:hypothetical protein